MRGKKLESGQPNARWQNRIEDSLLWVGSSARRSIECAIATIFVVNFLIFFGPFGADVEAGQSGAISNFLGPLVPFIWILWFVLMGVAFHLVVKRDDRLTRLAIGIVILFSLCALYPVYTFGFRSLKMGLAANIVMNGLLAILIPSLWNDVRKSALLLLPIGAWLVVASVWIIADLTGTSF